MSHKEKIIFHLDMDHFFTAIEVREQPQLKGTPVIVGADPKEGKGRGVVHTCNYEARRFGVKSAMPISRAWRLCPRATYLPPNYELYMKVSGEIMDTLRSHADKFEQWGIDEAFLDVTSKAGSYEKSEVLARHIKNEIFEKEKLTCSLGVGPNKLIAKIASDYRKPDGLTIIRSGDTETFLAPLPAGKLLWVGRKTERKLAEMGIKTIGDLARQDPAVLAQAFGSLGIQLRLLAHGIDNSDVEERGDVKSVSRDLTFEEDTSDLILITSTLDKLSVEVHTDVMKQCFYFKTVTIKVRYGSFETHTHGETLPRITNRLEDLTRTARELIKDYLKPGLKIRLIGVKVSSLVSTQEQRTLF